MNQKGTIAALVLALVLMQQVLLVQLFQLLELPLLVQQVLLVQLFLQLELLLLA